MGNLGSVSVYFSFFESFSFPFSYGFNEIVCVISHRDKHK